MGPLFGVRLARANLHSMSVFSRLSKHFSTFSERLPNREQALSTSVCQKRALQRLPGVSHAKRFLRARSLDTWARRATFAPTNALALASCKCQSTLGHKRCRRESTRGTKHSHHASANRSPANLNPRKIDPLWRTIMANIRPLHDRIIVKRLKEEEKTKGGIIIPDTAKEKPIEGEVLAVGNGKALENGTVRKLDVKVGDRVLFGKYSGTEVKIDGDDRLILREDDILAVLES